MTIMILDGSAKGEADSSPMALIILKSGAKGRSLTTGNNQFGNWSIGKNTPAKNIIGIVTATLIP